MKKPARSLRSPLGRARGLGSARYGTHHFWMQRVSAVALIPLSLWFVFGVAQLGDASYTQLRGWLTQPAVAIAMMLFVVSSLYHSALGVQVVIEDYVGDRGSKIAALMLSRFLHVFVAAASLFAVLKVALS